MHSIFFWAFSLSEQSAFEATVEGEALDVVDTVVAEAQVHDQFVLAVGQLVAALRTVEQRAAGAAGVRAVGTGEPLCAR